MNPHTIIVVNDFAYVEGGASQVALSSAVGLAGRGHQVHLLSAVGPVSEEITRSPVAVTVLGQRAIADDPSRFRAAMQGIWNRRAYSAMCELLAGFDHRTTAVHCHVWVKSLSSSVVRAALRSRFPVVITLHDYFTACPNGGFFNYPKRKICTLRAMSAACVMTNCDKRSYPQKLWRTARQWTQEHRGGVPARVGHFITVSEFSERILRPYLPSGCRTHRVPNPVFIQQGPPVNPDMNENIVFVGRLDPEKGPMLFAEAAAKTDVRAVFVGDGMCAQEIRRKCPSAVVTGWVGRDQVIQHLRQARALAFPSLWYETFGLTVTEAAALGVPAIVSEDSAAAELVEDGITGLHFRTGNVDDLCANLRRLSDGQTATRIGRAAYDRYWGTPTTIEHHLNHLERVYQEILS